MRSMYESLPLREKATYINHENDFTLKNLIFVILY